MQKVEIDLDATSLGRSSCAHQFFLTCIGEIKDGKRGEAYTTISNCHLLYGVGLHKFREVMFKTNGHIPTARMEALKCFNAQKEPPPKEKQWLGDASHFNAVCYNYWTEYVEKESSFDVIQIPQKCYWCKGEGIRPREVTLHDTICPHCKGLAIQEGPAVEITFRVPFYEDEYIIASLCGTIDEIGKFRNGIYSIGDLKTTSSWRTEEYLNSFEMSCQLRMYTLVCRLMSKLQPESILGRIGSAPMGAFIDAVFLKSKPNEVEYGRTPVYQFKESEMEEFHNLLNQFCVRLSNYIQWNNFPKEGLLNGTCYGDYGKPCVFWGVCRNDGPVADVLLSRFKRKYFDPLKYNESR